MKLKSLLFLFVQLTATGCEPLTLADRGTERAESRQDSLYVDIDLWPSTVPVCWINPNNNSSFDIRGRSWTRDAVENTWGKILNLKFTGWDQCPSNYATDVNFVAVAIQIAPSGQNQTYGLGYSARASYISVSMQLSFYSSSCETTPRDSEVCVKETAVHEFAHILGVAHEHQRPDKPASCTSNPSGPNGVTMIGPYDPLSIVNYCPGHLNKPSPLDIAGMQQIYGRKPPKSLVGPNGRCLDAVGWGTQPGTLVQLWDCNGTANQQWNWNGIQLTNVYSNLSLHPHEDGPLDLQAPSIYGLRFFEMQFMGIGGKCIDVEGSAGTTVQMYDCDAGVLANQVWDFSEMAPGAPTPIRWGTSLDKCLEVVGGGTSNGTPVMLGTCVSGPVPARQLWRHVSGGEIRSEVAAGKCLDVVGVSTADGARLQIYDCFSTSAAQNQLWSRRGKLGATSGYSNYVNAFGLYNGGSVSMFPAAVSGPWTYFP